MGDGRKRAVLYDAEDTPARMRVMADPVCCSAPPARLDSPLDPSAPNAKGGQDRRARYTTRPNQK